MMIVDTLIYKLVLATLVPHASVRFGRDIISLAGWVYAPVYALRKSPMYWKFVTARQVEWISTRRNGE